MLLQRTILDEIEEAHRLAEKGLHEAVAHANAEHPGWKERCWKIFVEWVTNKPPGYHFMIEDFRLYVACHKKIEKPPSLRSFGFLSKRANELGLIQHAGIEKTKNKTAHGANASIWCVI